MSILSFVGSIASRSKGYLGSGVLVTPTHLVTCEHVVGTVRSVTITVAGVTCNGTVLGVDREIDLALIQLDTQFTTVPSWSDEDPTHWDVHLYGFEQGQARNMSGKVLSTVRAQGRQFTKIDIQCSARFGLP